MTKNRMLTPQIISNVIRALSARGNTNLLILILQKRLTRGRPIIDNMPETSM